MLGEIPVELIADASKPPAVFGERGTDATGNSPEQPSRMAAAATKISKVDIRHRTNWTMG